MIEALEANMGNITLAAKQAGISVRTHYYWQKEDNDYDNMLRSLKNICYEKVRDRLLDIALKKIDKGDSTVLNKLIGIYFKNVPQEMEDVSRVNRPPLMAKINYADKPMWREMYEQEQQGSNAEGEN
jgi:hypothetical protein